MKGISYTYGRRFRAVSKSMLLGARCGLADDRRQLVWNSLHETGAHHTNFVITGFQFGLVYELHLNRNKKSYEGHNIFMRHDSNFIGRKVAKLRYMKGWIAGHARGKTSDSSVQHHAGCSREHRNPTLRGHGQTLFLSGESSRCQHRRTFPAMNRKAKTISQNHHGLPAQPGRFRPAVGPVLNAKADP